MKTYKSRISVVLVLLIAMVCFVTPIVTIKEPNIIGNILSVAIFIIIMVSFNGIKYIIDGETLKVYYFYGIHHDINIKTIRKIEKPCYKAETLVSSPAASMERIAIYYGKYDVIYISPRNQEDFIQTINEIVNHVF